MNEVVRVARDVASAGGMSGEASCRIGSANTEVILDPQPAT